MHPVLTHGDGIRIFLGQEFTSFYIIRKILVLESKTDIQHIFVPILQIVCQSSIVNELLHAMRGGFHNSMISTSILKVESFVSHRPHFIEYLLIGMIEETDFRISEVQFSVGIVSSEKRLDALLTIISKRTPHFVSTHHVIDDHCCIVITHSRVFFQFYPKDFRRLKSHYFVLCCFPSIDSQFYIPAIRCTDAVGYRIDLKSRNHQITK